MQFFELLLLTTSFGYIFFNRIINEKFGTAGITFLLFILLATQVFFEGVRWQMIPAYLLWLIAFITTFWQPKKQTSAITRVFKTGGLVILFITGILLSSILPVFDLPVPTGPFSIGTHEILLELERDEVITTDTSDTRKIMVKAWYPSNETGSQRDPYIDSGGRSGFARKYGLPPSTMDYLNQIETHVYHDVSVADKAFPVLLFSHGYNSKANGYYALLSEIVSHGYVVLAVNHTYESTGSTFPDGSEVYFHNGYAREIESNTWETITPVIEAFEKGLSFEERHPIVREALTSYFGRGIVERWANDISDVVDQLEDWNDSGILKGSLDLSKVGVFGHSRGGGAAGESLLRDERIKAGANLDGVQWGEIVDTTFQKPFLFISSDWPESHQNLIPHAYVNKSTSVFYDGMIRESGHSNFMDIPYMIPLQALSQAGAIDRDIATEIASRTVISFFNKHLKNEAVDMKLLSSEYELLELNIYEGDSLR